MDISSIKVSHILKCQIESGFASKTIKNYRNIFGQIMDMAHYDELIKKNPLKFAKAPKKIKKPVETFSESEVKLLIIESTSQMKNILQFNLFEGLRGSELIALRWDNMNFKENSITIDSRIKDGDEDETKSKQV